MDFLEEDTVTVPGQKYALISIVGPDSNQKSNISAVKIKGVFDNKEDANIYVEKLMKIDNSYDIFLVEMYKWLAIPPDVSSIENQVHQEKELNELIQGHKEQQILAKSHMEQRKRDDMEKSIEDLMKQKNEHISSSSTDSSNQLNAGDLMEQQNISTNSDYQLKTEDLKNISWAPGKALTKDEFEKMKSESKSDINVISANLNEKGKEKL